MKKFMFLLALFTATTFASMAQNATQFSLVAGDTVVTAATLDTVFKTLPVTAGYSALGIQVVATKISGTVTSKAYLYGSIDGTNYTVTDSVAFTNTAGAQSAFFTKSTTPYTRYQIQIRQPGVSTSTESLATKTYYVLRRYNQ